MPVTRLLAWQARNYLRLTASPRCFLHIREGNAFDQSAYAEFAVASLTSRTNTPYEFYNVTLRMFLARLCVGRAMFLLLGFVGLVASSAQYCQLSDLQDRFRFCLAFNTRLNHTSHLSDWAVIFGYQRPRAAGWEGVGIGSTMYKTLMFVTYGESNSTKGESTSLLYFYTAFNS